jgi:hypothetical protein
MGNSEVSVISVTFFWKFVLGRSIPLLFPKKPLRMADPGADHLVPNQMPALIEVC